jgi:hypothetical protein
MPDLERWFEPFFRDSSLWPVLVAGVAILVTLLATVLVLAVGDRNPGAIAALLALAWMSADATRRQLRAHRRPGLLGASILAVWALATAAALAARWSGIL